MPLIIHENRSPPPPVKLRNQTRLNEGLNRGREEGVQSQILMKIDQNIFFLNDAKFIILKNVGKDR